MTLLQVTLFGFNVPQTTGCTLKAVAQAELEAITLGTGGWEVLEGCEGDVQSERGEHVVHAVEARKAETRCILLWISRLTCAPSPPVSSWSRQWRVRHASATAIGRLMRWHQAREWLIGLMRITVSKCFFIPLWLAMQQICYLYSRLWWITETHSRRLHRVQSWLPGRHSARLFAIADLQV